MLFDPKWVPFYCCPRIDSPSRSPGGGSTFSFLKFHPPPLQFFHTVFTACKSPTADPPLAPHSNNINWGGEGGTPSGEPPPLGLSGRRSGLARQRFPGPRGGSPWSGRPGRGGGVRGAGQSAVSGVKLRVLDSLQLLGSLIALDAQRGRTWMAAEVRAAVGTLVCGNGKLSWSRIKPRITLPIYSSPYSFTPLRLVETEAMQAFSQLPSTEPGQWNELCL